MKTPDSKRRNTYLVALIISIILFYILTHLPELTRVQQSVGAYFNTVTIGCIIAYLMNPLAKFYERKLFKNLKRGRWALSIFFAFVTFIAAIVVLLVNPLFALLFLIITLVLQICDGYVIKPRLFGNSLGISGLVILLAIVTLGKAFGMGGLLLAIPIAAILDFTYREVLLPYLRKRKMQKAKDDSEE